MNITKEDIYGYTGSLIFCVLLMILLMCTVLKTIIPDQLGGGGVLVKFGNVDEASGTFVLAGSSGPAIPLPPTPPVPPVSQSIITQDLEQTASIDAENKRKEEEKLRIVQEEQKRLAEAERKRIEEEQKRQQAINNQIAGAFGSGNAQSAGQGNGTGQSIGTSGQGSGTGQGTGTSGDGIQGSPQGNSSYGANSGIGGYGDFSLSGRSLGSGGLPRPAYSVQVEGIIVIDIVVDKNGNVISNMIGRGTTISDLAMRQSAQDAAKKAKFNAISGNENQSGKITYRYYLR